MNQPTHSSRFHHAFLSLAQQVLPALLGVVIVSVQACSADARDTTPAQFNFIAYGDSRAGSDCSGNATHLQLVNRINQENADLVLHLGDMVTGYNNKTNWVENGGCNGVADYGGLQKLIAPLQSRKPATGLRAAFYPVIGNHDDNHYPDSFGNGFCHVFDPRLFYPNHTQQSYYLGTTKYSDDEFYSRACSTDSAVRDVYSNMLYFSFDYKNAHFIVLRVNDDNFDLLQCTRCLDQNDYSDYVNIHQLQWLRQDLASTSQDSAIKHIFVFLHAPIFTLASNHDGSKSWPILASEFSKYGVRAVFSGHNHLYERSLPITTRYDANHNPVAVKDTERGTTYFVSGGGGSPLYTVTTASRVSSGLMALSLPNFHYLKVSIDGNNLQVTAIDVDGSVIDKVSF